MALLARWDTNLVTVSCMRTVCWETGGHGREVPTNDASLVDATDSSQAFATRVRDSLRVSNIPGQILLSCARTTNDACEMLLKFPEAVVADVHVGTNSEKRP
jgi:hypothetical protein